jgi:hypothetical protein
VSVPPVLARRSFDRRRAERCHRRPGGLVAGVFDELEATGAVVAEVFRPACSTEEVDPEVERTSDDPAEDACFEDVADAEGVHGDLLPCDAFVEFQSSTIKIRGENTGQLPRSNVNHVPRK